MTTLSPRVRPLSACAIGATLALAFGVPCAWAQQQAPAPPPPPAPAQATPVVAPPVRLPPPPPPAAAPARAAAARQAVTLAPIRAPARVGLPVDSVRPAAAASVQPPANAVARCKDGTFIVPPATASGCATHRGLLVVMPSRTTPPAPTAAARVPAPAMAMQAATPANAAPPAGATMRCKDGTYLGGTPASGACGGHGGLAVVLPAPRTPPAAPAKPRRP